MVIENNDGSVWSRLELKSKEIHEVENEVLSPLLEEIDSIESSSIRSFVRSILLACEEFWTLPNGLDDKTLGDEKMVGGLVTHTKRTFKIAVMVAKTQGISGVKLDTIKAAALLHDVFKFHRTDDDHIRMNPSSVISLDVLVRSLKDIQKNLDPGSSSVNDLDPEIEETILRLVRTHKGLWSPIPELVPNGAFENVLHIADYISSNLKEITDGIA